MGLGEREFFSPSLDNVPRPQSDGQTEVVNRCLEQYLRSFVYHQPSKWNSLLLWAELWYNSSYHTSTNMTPFQALYGFNPSPIPEYSSGSSNVEGLDRVLTERMEVWEQLKSNLKKAQKRMKNHADKKRSEKEFAIGDWVLLKLQHYRQESVAKRLNYKLSKRFYGPYRIIARVGTVAYRLDLPQGSKIHPVFHVSLLKEFRGNPINQSPLPVNAEIFQPKPVAIVAERVRSMNSQDQVQVLVEWNGVPRDEATWENWEELVQVFGQDNLEDKVIFEGGAIDTDPNHEPRPNKTNEEMNQSTGPEKDLNIVGPETNTSSKDERPQEELKRIRRPPVWAQDYQMPNKKP